MSVTDYILEPGKIYEDDTWLYDGAYPEHIIMTGVYYCQRDVELIGGDIEFKRFFEEKEAQFISKNMFFKKKSADPNDPVFPRSEWFINICSEFIKPLGKISNLQTGDVVIFPTCHFYRFKKLENPLLNRTLRQRLIRFYLVHPHRPILSTADTSPLVVNRRNIPLVDALKCRSELREERLQLLQYLM